MNFVTELLKSKDYNAILIIIDQLIKMRHYIVYKAEEKRTSAEYTVCIYIKHI